MESSVFLGFKHAEMSISWVINYATFLFAVWVKLYFLINSFAAPFLLIQK